MVPSFDAPCRWQWMNLVVVLNFDDMESSDTFSSQSWMSGDRSGTGQSDWRLSRPESSLKM
jgi:hypothetical protein